MTSFNSRLYRCLFKLSLAVTLAGCAAKQSLPLRWPPVPSSSGDATWHMEGPENALQYQLSAGEVASGASLLERAVPVYPPALLATCPAPTQIRAVLIVDKAGNVGEVRVADEASADEQHRLFIASVRAAALQWKFEPLKFDHWTDDADGGRHVVSSETRPFSGAYVFRFECRAGRAEVSSDQAADH